jgi:hypothetical protein
VLVVALLTLGIAYQKVRVPNPAFFAENRTYLKVIGFAELAFVLVIVALRVGGW